MGRTRSDHSAVAGVLNEASGFAVLHDEAGILIVEDGADVLVSTEVWVSQSLVRLVVDGILGGGISLTYYGTDSVGAKTYTAAPTWKEQDD